MSIEPQDIPKDPKYKTYICSECATRYEGKWPKGHVATFHYGVCDFCNKRAGICHTRNYDWGYAGRPI